MIPYTTHPEKFNWTNLKAELLCFLVNSLFLALAIGFCFLFTGCGTSRQVAVVDRTTHDTLYINKVQYDSIYIFKKRYQDRSKDTVYLKDVSIECRYKLLKDTVRIVERDSVPYEVTIIETKEVVKPPTLFDKICQYSFFLQLGAFLFWIIRFACKVLR